MAYVREPMLVRTKDGKGFIEIFPKGKGPDRKPKKQVESNVDAAGESKNPGSQLDNVSASAKPDRGPVSRNTKLGGDTP